jgi:Flp pilus assembly CpaF family ATPase
VVNDQGPAPADERELVATLRTRVAAALAADPGVDGQRSRRVEELIERELDAYTRAGMRDGQPVPGRAAETRIARQIRDGLLRYGGFQPWLEHPEVDNITCQGCDHVHVSFADGTKRKVGPVADTDEELIELVRQIAAHAGAEERRFDRGSPQIDVQLADGSRLFAVMAVCARPSVTIRRHRFVDTNLAELREKSTIDARLQDLLTALVLARRNIVISGGTNIGKTTLLRALAAVIPPEQRLVTIEDVFELWLDRDRDDVVAMQARRPNTEGVGAIDSAELVRWSLRMSPHRVIVGEARGPEVLDMLKAMSQGNDGSLATVHASSSKGALLRLATYALQTPERLTLEAANLFIGGAVDVVVHLDWGPAGSRVVSSVLEVAGAEGNQIATNEIFRPGPDKRAVPSGVPPSHHLYEDLVAAGAPHNLFGGGWSP